MRLCLCASDIRRLFFDEDAITALNEPVTLGFDRVEEIDGDEGDVAGSFLERWSRHWSFDQVSECAVIRRFGQVPFFGFGIERAPTVPYLRLEVSSGVFNGDFYCFHFGVVGWFLPFLSGFMVFFFSTLKRRRSAT